MKNKMTKVKTVCSGSDATASSEDGATIGIIRMLAFD